LAVFPARPPPLDPPAYPAFRRAPLPPDKTGTTIQLALIARPAGTRAAASDRPASGRPSLSRPAFCQPVWCLACCIC